MAAVPNWFWISSTGCGDNASGPTADAICGRTPLVSCSWSPSIMPSRKKNTCPRRSGWCRRWSGSWAAPGAFASAKPRIETASISIIWACGFSPWITWGGSNRLSAESRGTGPTDSYPLCGARSGGLLENAGRFKWPLPEHRLRGPGRLSLLRGLPPPGDTKPMLLYQFPKCRHRSF